MSVRSVLRAVQWAGCNTPHRPSLLFVEPRGTRQFSARDLSVAMGAWARGLSSFRPVGSAFGDAITVLIAPRGLGAYASLLGAMRAGMAGCILPGPTVKQDRDVYWESHRAVLARIAPAVVVASADLAPELTGVLPPGTPLVDSARPPPSGEGALPPLDEVGADDVKAILQHSSGTTGLKRGVVLTHGQIRGQVDAYSAALGMGRSDTVASWLPLYHDMGLVTAVLLPLSLGSMIVSIDPFDWLARPASILEEVTRYRATFCWLPNFAFAHLTRVAADQGPFDLSRVRSFVDCSEPCRAGTLSAFAAAFARHGLAPGALSACYAMAETVFAVTQTPVGCPPTLLSVDAATLSDASVAVPVEPGSPGSVRLVSCGPPIAGTNLRIIPRSAPAPSGVWSALSGLFRSRSLAGPGRIAVGDILIASGSTFAGYHRDPHASALVLQDGWYRSGDLGFIHGGELYVTGRTKDLIIVNGRNLYAHDIEAAAGEAEGVKPGRAAAFGIDRPSTGSEAVVVVVETVAEPSLAVDLVAKGVREAVARALGLVLHDVLVGPPGMLVKTTSGKVSREGNKRKYVEGAMA